MSVVAPEGTPSPQDLAQSLSDAIQADAGAPPAVADAPPAADPAAPANPDPAAPTPGVDPAAQGTPASADDDSLLAAADIDLNGLTPEAQSWLQAREREMQAVMTKRTQEAAEIRKQYEGLGDPDEVRAALGFYKGIQTDPNYAAEVYDFLTQNLTAAGYSPAQAAAKALEAMNEGVVQETPADAPAPAAFPDDLDEAVQQRLAQLDERQRQIDARIAAAEAREREAQEVNRILQQDNALRQANPDLTDEQMDFVYQLAESTQGNLFEAHKTFQSIQEASVQHYLSRKDSVNAPAPPPAAPPADIVHAPKTLEEGYRMGLERLRNVLADGG